MLDVGWTELVVIAIVLIIVVGPKDLPPMLRTFGKMMSKMRGMAADFRHQFDEALREADLDDVRKTLSDAQRLNPANSLREAMNPLRQMGNDIKADLQKATRPDEKSPDVPSDAPAVDNERVGNAPVTNETASASQASSSTASDTAASVPPAPEQPASVPPAPQMAASIATPVAQPAAATVDSAPSVSGTSGGAPAPVTKVSSAPLTNIAPPAAAAPVASPVPLADDASVGPKPRKRAVKAVEGTSDLPTPRTRKRASASVGAEEVAEIGAKLSRRKKPAAAEVAPETPNTPKSGDDA